MMLAKGTAAAAIAKRGPALKKAIAYATAASRSKYLQESPIPTYHFQKSLPRLPIPELPKTCDRYVAAVTPLLTPAQLETTKKNVQQFLDGEGAVLHKELLAQDAANPTDSYISGPWFDMYLQSRDPLPLNFNPFMSFNNDPNPKKNTQSDRAAALIVSAMRFYNSLREQKLKPDVYHTQQYSSNFEYLRFLPQSVSYYGAYSLFKAYPLDMSQYPRLLASTRIPKPGRDELWTAPKTNHVVVSRAGEFFRVEIADPNTLEPHNPATIRSAIDSILRLPVSASVLKVGYLTGINRDQWAKVRKDLESDAANRAALEAIDSGLFFLALDSKTPQNSSDMTQQYLYGDGSNRWFDKSFSLIVTPSGSAALNFEHSWGDGVAVLRFFNEVFSDMVATQPISDVGSTAAAANQLHPLVQPIKWNSNAQLQAAVESAEKDYRAQTSTLRATVMEREGFGKAAIKTAGLSPDGVVQMSFQIAHRRIAGFPAPTYESCSTAAFRKGRTETIRSCSVLSEKMCDAFENAASSDADRLQALSAAVKYHSKLVKEANFGNGFDRHLFALRKIAATKGAAPAIFLDPAYARINHNILSTSTLTSPALYMGGFAPVVADGFGIAYKVEDNMVSANVTKYGNGSDQFVSALDSALRDIQRVLPQK